MQTKHNPHMIAYARLRHPVWIGKREAVKYSFIWHVKDYHTSPLKDLAFVKWKEPHFTYRKLSALATARLNPDSILNRMQQQVPFSDSKDSPGVKRLLYSVF